MLCALEGRAREMPEARKPASRPDLIHFADKAYESPVISRRPAVKPGLFVSPTAQSAAEYNTHFGG